MPSPSEPDNNEQINQENLSINETSPSEHPSNDEHSYHMDSPHNNTLGDITLPAIDPIIDLLDTSFYEAHQGNENNPESHAANPLEILPSTAEI